jgi:hypothetical protein
MQCQFTWVRHAAVDSTFGSGVVYLRYEPVRPNADRVRTIEPVTAGTE